MEDRYLSVTNTKQAVLYLTCQSKKRDAVRGIYNRPPSSEVSLVDRPNFQKEASWSAFCRGAAQRGGGGQTISYQGKLSVQLPRQIECGEGTQGGTIRRLPSGWSEM